MKKTFISILAILAVTFSINAQWVKKSNGLDSTKAVYGFVQSGSNIFNCNYGGVFLSTNNGDNWTAVNSGLTNTNVLSFAGSGNNLYAGTYGGGIFRSTNSGANWSISGYPGHRIWSLCIKGTEVFAGRESGGLSRSIDSGATWVPAGLGVSFIFSIACSNNNIFTGTRSGVYRSTDNGLNWTNVLSLGIDVGAVAINGSYIYAGTNGLAGVYISSNNGTNWTACNSGMSHYFVNSFAFWGNNVFAGLSGAVYISSNGGVNWQLKNEGSFPPFNIYRLIITNNYIFAGTGEQSVWRRAITDLIVPLSPSLISPLNNSLGQSLSLNLVWTKTQFSTKYRLLLAADSLFTNVIVNDSLLTDSVKNVSNLNPLTNYFWKVSAGNTAGWSNYSSVYKFKTIGSPTQVNLFFPANNSVNQPLNLVFRWFKAIDQTVKSNRAVSNYWLEYSADSTFQNGVFKDSTLTDSLKSVTGLNNTVKYYWRVKAKNTAGWGNFSSVWNFTTEEPLGIMQIGTEIPSVYSLNQNYPNPFNPITKIRFDVPRSENVIIKVYDMLGKEISTLVNRQLQPGTYETDWDASYFSSGVYYYKIISGNYIETKKMILMK